MCKATMWCQVRDTGYDNILLMSSHHEPVGSSIQTCRNDSRFVISTHVTRYATKGTASYFVSVPPHIVMINFSTFRLPSKLSKSL